jgi:5-methylthioadenosine/S-adenosylhomocysteine deaminase
MQQTAEQTCDLLVTADILLTQDGERRIIEDAAVAIKDGRINVLGTRSELAHMLAKEHLSLRRSLLMPGLVNAHTHVSMTLFRGLADDLPLMEWLTEHIFPREKHLTAEVVQLGALLGCAEMIRTGTTAFQDMYLIENAVAEAVNHSGLRCRMGEGIFAFPSPAYASIPEAYALVREQAACYKNHPRIRVAVMPHSVYTTTPEIMIACRDLARELGLPLHLHLAETAVEVQTCLDMHGKGPVEYCRELDLLSPYTTIAHGVVLTGEELDILASTGTCVAHNPRSNMKLASGVAPVPDMLARGMLPGLGTDGASSNNSLNMFAEMSACALLHKVHRLEATACPAQTVLDMATLGSAAALHWPELGRIEPGAPADLIALNLDSPNLQPLYSPVSHLVYAASGHELHMCMVDGKVLYKDGAYFSLDYPVLLSETQKLKKWVLDRK